LCGYGLDIVNSEPLTLEQAVSFCRQSQSRYEQILITDDSLVGMDNYAIKGALASLTLLQEQENRKQPIRLISNRAQLQAINVVGVSIETFCSVRVSIREYIDAATGATMRGGAAMRGGVTERGGAAERGGATERGGAAIRDGAQERATDGKKSGGQPRAWKSAAKGRRRERAAKPEAPLPDREFDMISREISRVVAITGHRGSGVTSTAVNLAHVANNRNLSTIAIDLDTVNRTFNLYFNEYYKSSERDQDIACSLVRCLAKPQSYCAYSHRHDNLYVVSLAYSFSDDELLGRFLTPARLINMLTLLRKNFQLCLLDIPLEALGQLKECALYVDTFGLCVPNNLYSLSGTLCGFAQVLTQEEMDALFGKSVVIVSKYNERMNIQEECFSPEKVCELLLELSDAPLSGEFELAGHIPYHPDFDAQLETDIPITASDAYMEKAYSEILLRVIKGAGKA